MNNKDLSSNSILYLLFFLASSYGMTVSDGCSGRSEKFALPAGSYEDGKMSFVGLNCNSCHSVADVDWDGMEGRDVHLRLGGEKPNITTYQELVTAIINPSHKIAREFKIQTRGKAKDSPMSNYNEVMTVQELVDVVTFLQAEYKFRVPTPMYESW